MSKSPIQPSPSAPGIRQRAQLRFSALKSNRQRSALGLAEIVGLASAAVILFAVIVAYFSFLVPAKLRLQAAGTERLQLQERIKTKSAGMKDGSDKETSVQQISQSLVDFEARALETRSAGRISLIAELNELFRSHELKNTTGPVFIALDQLGENGKPVVSTATKSGNAKWQSFYPGIGVSVTLDGQYQNLRYFIRDLEANKHFVVINAVQLEKASDTAAPALTALVPGAPLPTASKSSLVSLQLDMVTYFRRETSDAGNAALGAIE